MGYPNMGKNNEGKRRWANNHSKPNKNNPNSRGQTQTENNLKTGSFRSISGTVPLSNDDKFGEEQRILMHKIGAHLKDLFGNDSNKDNTCIE